MKDLNKYAAEFIGTFFLVLFGCSSIIVNDLYNNCIGHVGISLVFGIIVMVLIYAIGNISGAHINPAVTLGFFCLKKISAKASLLYIISQFLGSVCAAFVLHIAFPDHKTLGATIPCVSVQSAFAIEFLFTFILMFVILTVSSGHKENATMSGIAVGGIIFLEALIGGPLTGASMNPARSLGPALVSLNLSSVALYLAAPTAGAVFASFFCTLFLQKEKC